MDFNEYQEQALKMRAHDLDGDTALSVWALGISGEAGEVAEHIKKYLGHGHELDREKVSKELGDVLWYLATMAEELDLSLSDIAQQNLDKLKARYGEKFSSEASINRSETKH